MTLCSYLQLSEEAAARKLPFNFFYVGLVMLNHRGFHIARPAVLFNSLVMYRCCQVSIWSDAAHVVISQTAPPLGYVLPALHSVFISLSFISLLRMQNGGSVSLATILFNTKLSLFSDRSIQSLCSRGLLMCQRQFHVQVRTIDLLCGWAVYIRHNYFAVCLDFRFYMSPFHFCELSL